MGTRTRLQIILLRQLRLGLEYGWKVLNIDILCFKISIDFHKHEMEFFKFSNYFKESSY